MANKNIIYCKIHPRNCSYNRFGIAGEITRDKNENYFCKELKKGTCSYLIELKNQEKIANALEKLIKTLETIKL